MRGLFITGTDTGVGKTYVGCQLIEAWVTLGQAVSPRKPVESGCALKNGELWPADGALLHQAAGGKEALHEVTPLRFAHALAPDRAAKQVGKTLTLEQLTAICTQPCKGLRIVEGAGGLLSPLASDALNADLAKTLRLPVLLVAPDRLGVINHVLLNLEALKLRGLDTLGVVLNRMDALGSPALPEGIDNLHDLSSRADLPIWSLNGGPANAAQQIAQDVLERLN